VKLNLIQTANKPISVISLPSPPFRQNPYHETSLTFRQQKSLSKRKKKISPRVVKEGEKAK